MNMMLSGTKRLLVAAIGIAAAVGAAGAQDAVSISAEPMRPRVHAGQTLPVAVIIDHAPGYHTWPAVEQDVLGKGFDFAVRTKIGVSAQSSQVGSIGPVQLPEPKPAPVPNPITWEGTVNALVYKDRAVAYLPVVISDDALPGPGSVTVEVYFQTCDEEVCLQPETVSVEVPFEVVPSSDELGAVGDPDLFAGYDSEGSAAVGGSPQDAQTSAPGGADDAQAQGIPVDFLGYFFYVQTWMMFPIALLAGLILNLTPCVLPVIPLKVLSVQQHAKEPGKLALFGTVYCLGIIAMFAVIAALVGIFGQAWGQLNGYWWFSIPLAAIVAAMGLSMLGLFTIRLPQSVYMVNPSGDSVGGNFMLGVLTAILSTPCTGPMLGAVLLWSATQSRGVGVFFVLLMGVGMAAPYALLIFYPKLVDRVPRTGPGSELLKQVLGLLMLAVAVYVLSFLTTATWTWWFVGLLASLAFVWMYFAGLRVLQSTNGKILVSHGAILGLLVTLLLTRAMTGSGEVEGAGGAAGQIQWTTFKSPADGSISERIDSALADGRVVVVDFTAKWCPNCHVIEKTVLNSPVGRSLLTMPGLVAIKVDITDSGYAEGLEVLSELSEASSIPFLAVMGPQRSRDRPVAFRSFFKPSDLRLAIEQAWGAPIDGQTELVLRVGTRDGTILPVGNDR